MSRGLPWANTINVPRDGEFGGVFDVATIDPNCGTNMWPAFAMAVARQQALGGTVHFSAHCPTYLLPAPQSLVVQAPLRITADPGVNIDFSGSVADVLDVRSTVRLQGVTARGWSAAGAPRRLLNLTEATSQVPLVWMFDCDFADAPDGWVLFCDRLNAGGANTAGLAKLFMLATKAARVGWGVQLDTFGLGACQLFATDFQDIEENAVWLGRDYAANLADFLAQGPYQVEGGTFRRIGDGSVQSAPDRHAIILFGSRACVEGNVVEHVQNDTGNDCEGIYLKVVGAVVTGNSLKNAGAGQGCIAQKGRAEAVGQTPGHNTVISSNEILADGSVGATSAISLGVGTAVVECNDIEGMTDTAIVAGAADGEFLDLLLAQNRIKNTVANVAVSLNCPGARSVKLIENTVDGVDGGAGNAVGIQVTNSGTLPYQELTLRGNTLKGITGAGTIVAGILDNMTQNPSATHYEITKNLFQSVADGVYFAAAAPRPTRLAVEENDFVGCSGAGLAGPGASALLTQNVRVRRNQGYLTENSGVVTFAGSTAEVVTHGVQRFVRPERRISLVYVGATPPAGPASISAAGATTFTINFSAAHTGQVGWQILEHVEPDF